MLPRISSFEHLTNFYKTCLNNRFAIAIWRNPNNKEKHVVVDLSGKKENVEFDIGRTGQGFVISPFQNQSKNSAFINAHFYWRTSNYKIRKENFLGNDTAIQPNKILFENTFNELCNADTTTWLPQQFFFTGLQGNKNSTSKDRFCSWVEEAIHQIKQSDLEKVVLSRVQEIDLPGAFEPCTLFDQLCSVYPNAFISLVAIPDVGTWLGASPELLLRVTETELSTIALAGTLRISENQEEQRTWRKKELVEQELVSQYIRNCFVQNHIENFIEQGPETIQIGNLIHLRTTFTLQQSHIREKPINAILQSLHPTPAVCGCPQKTALSFINRREIHDREFYCGYLGPVNIENQSQLFVNLRCLQLSDDAGYLYAGAGITADSIPEQEWLETELKLNALRQFLSTSTDVTHLSRNFETPTVH